VPIHKPILTSLPEHEKGIMNSATGKRRRAGKRGKRDGWLRRINRHLSTTEDFRELLNTIDHSPDLAARIEIQQHIGFARLAVVDFPKIQHRLCFGPLISLDVAFFPWLN
jgi:hypothetical protein